jgi:hypothetical protein
MDTMNYIAIDQSRPHRCKLWVFANTVSMVERNMCNAVMRGIVVPDSAPRVRRAFLAHPDRLFRTVELAALAYPRLTGKVHASTVGRSAEQPSV